METISQTPTVDLSAFNNSWYYPGPKWKIFLWYLVNSIFINSYLPIPIKIKVLILRFFGAQIGSRVVIKPAVNIKYPWLLSVGDNVWLGENVWIDNLAEATIGDHVCISQGAMLLTGNHDYTRATFDLILEPIRINQGVWIGAFSIICPGVLCDSHSVLAVGSVATSNLEAYGIYRGNPAKWEKKREIDSKSA